jgi:hypothetical protein
MYIIDDKSFAEMLGGEFYQVILAKKHEPNISVYKLFKFQFKYNTYVGFRNFYKKHLEPVLNGIRLIDENSLKAKVIRFLTNEKNK